MAVVIFRPRLAPIDTCSVRVTSRLMKSYHSICQNNTSPGFDSIEQYDRAVHNVVHSTYTVQNITAPVFLVAGNLLISS